MSAFYSKDGLASLASLGNEEIMCVSGGGKLGDALRAIARRPVESIINAAAVATFWPVIVISNGSFKALAFWKW